MSNKPTAQQSYDAPSDESTEGLSIAILGLGRAGQPSQNVFWNYLKLGFTHI